MSIEIADSLVLLAIEAGQVNAPLAEGAAEGSSQLDSQQRAAVIGEPIPIVFGKRTDAGTGGVLISPAATEARFENDATNNVTAYYHLVLSEGQIGSIQVRDVFQRSCRVGSHSQTYNRRAGTWSPGNAIVQRSGYSFPEASYYCGSVGVYTNMSTLSFSVTIPNGFDYWNRQVHCFIRNGMIVPRLIEGTDGSSNNYADLVRWCMINSSKIPSTLIDATTMTSAANFMATNGFNCDINIKESTNLPDLLAKLSPYFLVTETRVNGKRGLRPLLPINANYTINTGTIAWEFTFTEEHILPGSFEISYVPLADRKAFCAQMIWRQQLTDDFGIIRTADVRYANTAESGPYEQHDLSTFCTVENHAVKAGAYILARRKHITHTLRISTKPGVMNMIVDAGDIVRVTLQRQASNVSITTHDFLYEVNRVTKTLRGDLTFDLTHFPVNSSGASLVALDVASATGTGVLLTSNKSGVGCDVNSSTNTSVPAETYTTGSAPYGESFVGGGGSSSNESVPPGTQANPPDLYEPLPPHTVTPESAPITDGSALYPYDGQYGPCAEVGSQTKSITWYKNGTKLATINFDESGNETSRVAAPGQTMPAWLPVATPGVLVIGAEGQGIYTSVVECWNGSSFGRRTVAEAFSPTAYSYWRSVHNGSRGAWLSTASSKPRFIGLSLSYPCVISPGGQQDWYGGGTFTMSGPCSAGGTLGSIYPVNMSNSIIGFSIATWTGSVSSENPYVVTDTVSFEFSNNSSTVIAAWAGYQDNTP